MKAASTKTRQIYEEEVKVRNSDNIVEKLLTYLRRRRVSSGSLRTRWLKMEQASCVRPSRWYTLPRWVSASTSCFTATTLRISVTSVRTIIFLIGHTHCRKCDYLPNFHMTDIKKKYSKLSHDIHIKEPVRVPVFVQVAFCSYLFQLLFYWRFWINLIKIGKHPLPRLTYTSCLVKEWGRCFK